MAHRPQKILFWSNNKYFEESFLKQSTHPDIEFISFKESQSIPYLVAFIDLSKNLEDISQKTINLYKSCLDYRRKFIVLLHHSSQVDFEKNSYFQELLNNLGGKQPIHRLVLTRDLFQTSLLYAETPLEKYIFQSLQNYKITVSSKGKNLFFPLSVDDLITTIQKILYLQSTSGKVFWILGEPILDLEIAYLIKKHFSSKETPEFEIDASGPNDNTLSNLNTLSNQSRAQLNWEPKDDFPQNLKIAIKKIGEDSDLLISKIHQNFSQEKNLKFRKLILLISKINFLTKSLFNKSDHNKHVEKISEVYKKILRTIFVTISLTYLFFSTTFVIFTGLSLKYLEETLYKLQAGDTILSVKALELSQKYHQLGKGSYSFLSLPISIVFSSTHESIFNLYVLMNYAQSSLETLQQTYKLAEKVYQTIGIQTAENYYIDASLALRSNLSRVYENINQIKLLVNNNKIPNKIKSRISDSREFSRLSEVEYQITHLLKTVEIIPDVLSGSNAKNIVILSQNSQEPRGTGGVIDHIIVLTLDSGRLVSHKTYDSSDLNKLAIGVIPAPPLIRQQTKDIDWKIGDMNYNPDYPQTAANISWYLERTLKFKPDIILAINDTLINDLLDQKIKTTINGLDVSKEVFLKDLQSKDTSQIYKDLTSHYLNKIFTHEIPVSVLGRVLAKQSKENQILYWSADTSIESSILGQSLSGSIFPKPCHGSLPNTTFCLPETTYLNHSLFIRSQEPGGIKILTNHEVNLLSERVDHEYQIEYVISESSFSKLESPNAIIQLYGPASLAITSIVVNEESLPVDSLTRQSDQGLTRLQIPITLQNISNNKVNIKFSSQADLPLKSAFSYSLAEYRQPGVPNNDATLTINYPGNLRPSVLTADATQGPTSLTFKLPAKTSIFGVYFVTNSQ